MIAECNSTRFAVFGVGLSGSATLNYLIEKKYQVFAWDDNKLKRKQLEKDHYKVVDLNKFVWKKNDLLVVSPGIKKNHSIVKRAIKYGVKITGDLDLLWNNLCLRKKKPVVIGVTGTNGKSTVVSMISKVLDVEPLGNIGKSVLDVSNNYNLPMVIELSSFQLDLVESFTSNISVLINIFPDHLNHHGSFKKYLIAKRKIYKNQKSDDFVVLNFDDPQTRKEINIICKKLNHPKVIPVSLKKNMDKGISLIGTEIKDNIFESKPNYTYNFENNKVLGKSRINFAIAYAACRVYGIKPSKIIKKLCEFVNLPHRLERVGLIGETLFINDSKATNVAATMFALSSFDKIIWIAGGREKGDDFKNLEMYSNRILKAYFIGESAEKLNLIFKNLVKVMVLTSLEDAMLSAYRFAKNKKDSCVIMFSPACSSYDQYKDFEDRGKDFRRIYKNIKKKTDNVFRRNK